MNLSRRVPGFERFRAHLPGISAVHGPFIALIALAFISAATAGFVVADRQGWFWAAVTELAAFAFVIAWTGQAILRSKSYRKRWGDRAYRNAFAMHVLPGMPVMIAAIAHIGYMPGPFIPFGPARLPILILASLLAVVGVALWIRSMFAFGVDNLALLYVYFPEEGRLVDSSIYAVLRHPVYAAATYVCLALGLWRGTWLSLAFGLLAPFGLTVWLRLVEERELIERFGEGYREYRRRVPAFYPRPRDWGTVLRFLLAGR